MTPAAIRGYRQMYRPLLEVEERLPGEKVRRHRYIALLQPDSGGSVGTTGPTPLDEKGWRVYGRVPQEVLPRNRNSPAIHSYEHISFEWRI